MAGSFLVTAGKEIRKIDTVNTMHDLESLALTE